MTTSRLSVTVPRARTPARSPTTAGTAQTASATGGDGGSNNAGGDGGQAEGAGGWGENDASGGYVRANGGDAYAGNGSDVDQSNQIAGRDNQNDYESEYVCEKECTEPGHGGGNFTAACNGFDSGNTCDQRNSATTTQGAAATGGNGGSHNTAGNGGQAKGAGGHGDNDASGGDVKARGGNAWAGNWSEIGQSNQVAGRNNRNGANARRVPRM